MSRHAGKLSGLVAALLVACGSSMYTVSDDRKEGIPFLPIESVDVETWVYEQAYFMYDVTGTFQRHVPAAAEGSAKGPASKPSEPPKFSKHVVAYSADFSDASTSFARNLYAHFIVASDAVSSWESSGVELANGLASQKVLVVPPAVATTVTDIRKLPLVAVDHSRAQVPGATARYYNVHMPAGGSASAEIDLAANGTLTKATSQKQDQLIATIAGTVNAIAGSSALNTVAAHFFAAPQKAQAAADVDIVAVDLRIVPVRRLYTITLTHPSSLTSAECDRDDRRRDGDASPCRLSVSSKMVTGGDSGDDGKDKDKKDPGTITISGAVKLPAPGDDKK